MNKTDTDKQRSGSGSQTTDAAKNGVPSATLNFDGLFPAR